MCALKSKILTRQIHSCTECAHYWWQDSRDLCNLANNRELPQDEDIPDWCPLPDSEEGTESQTRSLKDY